MTTDADRTFSRVQAKLIHAKLLLTKTDHQYCTNLPGEEILYRGILTECEFAHEFGLRVDGRIYRGGDGGKDFILRLNGQDTHVNVKSEVVKTCWEALRRHDPWLRVPVPFCSPSTIYVYGIYIEPTDTAEVLAWEWGKVLIKENQRRTFPNGDGGEAFIKKFARLRSLEELRDRMPGWLARRVARET